MSTHCIKNKKPGGTIPNVTEIRENYQNPNPMFPQRPMIHRLADTLEKVHQYIIFDIDMKNNDESKNFYSH